MAEPQRTHPLGFLVTALSGARSAILPIIAVSFGAGETRWGGFLVLAMALAALSISGTFSFLGWWRRFYIVGPEDIRVESGIFSRSARSIPYERIQDVSLEQKFLPRLFGLVELQFETGAGGKDEMALAYLTLPEGERLRELVRERRDSEGGAETPAADGAMPEGAAEKALDSPPIFAMSSGRILLFGLFEFSLVAFAVLLGLAQQLDFLLPFDPWDWHEWADYAPAGQDLIEGVSGAGRVLAALAGLGGVIVLGLSTGLVRTFAREYGFRLDRTAKGFRRRRGLFNLTDVVMPAHRVQAVLIGTGWVRARFGWHELEFVSLAQDGKNTPSHAVAPFARLEEIWPIAEAAGIHRPDDALGWKRPMTAPWVLRFVVLVLVLGTANFALAAMENWALLYVAALWLPVLMLRQFLGWQRQGFALDATQLYIRFGHLAPTVAIAERRKLQSVEIRQGPVARRLGYCTIHFGLAGGHMAIAGLAMKDAPALRAAVLDSIASVDFSELPH